MILVFKGRKRGEEIEIEREWTTYSEELSSTYDENDKFMIDVVQIYDI